MRESGGEYLYLHRAIHPLAGFIAGWISLLAGFPGAIAFAATALEAYVRAARQWASDLPEDFLAVAVVVAAGVLHMVRVKAGAKTHEWIVALMLGALALIVLWSGLVFIQDPALPVPADVGVKSFSLFAFANSLVWISLSYSGFNAAAYVTGEVHNPGRRVKPRVA